jgi:hypothetical protein
MNMESSEFAPLRSSGMIIGGTECGSQVLNGILTDNSSGIEGVLTLQATRTGAYAKFEVTSSTFHAISVQAEDGIFVEADVTTTGGDVTTTGGVLHVDGDSDDSSVGGDIDTVGFTDERTVTAATLLTLESMAESTLIPAGKISLRAGAGIVILEDLITAATGNSMILDADFDSQGDGTLTVWSSKNVTSADSDIVITACDVDLAGQLTAGVASLLVHPSTNNQTIGVDTVVKDMHVTDAELGRMTSAAGATFGSSIGGHLLVSGITTENSDTIGTVTLITTQRHKQVSFEVLASSFNKGIVVQAMGGVVLSQSLTTKSCATVLRGGTGKMYIRDRMSLSTSDQLLTVTADDLELWGIATLSTGTAASFITTETAQSIGLGTAGEDMHIHVDELRRITSHGMTIGSDGVNAGITVVSMPRLYTDNILEILTLVATLDDSTVQFLTGTSTFFALSVRTDNGVVLEVDVTTTEGYVYLDGDYENSSSSDCVNGIDFTDGLVLQSKTLMMLEATQGTFVPAGTVSLRAGTGIVLFDDMISANSSKAIVIDADFEDAGNGTLSVVASKVVDTNNGELMVSMWDLDLDGGFMSGTASIAVHGAKASQTVGLGLTQQDMHIEDGEIGRITTSNSLTIGSSTSGSLVVDGLTEVSTHDLGRLILLASKHEQAA